MQERKDGGLEMIKGHRGPGGGNESSLAKGERLFQAPRAAEHEEWKGGKDSVAAGQLCT